MSQAATKTPDPEQLRSFIVQVKAEDSMAEAGRKILLVEFIRMLENESGSYKGEDPEYVHHMRVATRRMRSAFRILEPHFKSKSIRPFIEHLSKLAKALGGVRDLDVMIGDLQVAQTGEEEDTQAGIQVMIDRLERRRRRARKKLLSHLDSSPYQHFKETFATFLTQVGKGVISVEGNGISVVPHQVRHVLPGVLHEHLAYVRAYDTILGKTAEESKTDDETPVAPRVDPLILHDLRIEFKRLRYTVSFFKEVLGQSGGKFVNEIKIIQDHLGRLNDLVVAQAQLHTLLNETGLDEALLHSTLAKMAAEQIKLEDGFPPVWAKFNTRTVQSHLSNALLTLR